MSYSMAVQQSPSQFLPGFLMGDLLQQQPTTTQSILTNSPPKVAQTINYTPLRQTFKCERSATTKQSCTTPPTQSLWSTLNRKNTSISAKPPISSQTRNFEAFNSPSFASPAGANNNNSDRLYNTVLNTQNDISEAGNDFEKWVTVFGFPLSKSAFVLQEFSKFGIIDRHVTTNNGNWIHLKYRTHIQTQTALSKNGRILGDNIMIGVRPCEDQSIMISDKGVPFAEQSHNQSNFGSAPFADRTNTPQKIASVSRNASMRVLGSRRTYQSQMNHSLSNSDAPKNKSAFSKAFGYVFGWS
ncbi:Nucleoporin nup35 [Cichlidogyrus casuarinus]|uniref:Nucleoporin NUP53 n=1 Tax=Cichlidogyrus casuarinus TaxID=1844966 RepID=A0ABD2Q8A4_9PLAT